MVDKAPWPRLFYSGVYPHLRSTEAECIHVPHGMLWGRQVLVLAFLVPHKHATVVTYHLDGAKLSGGEDAAATTRQVVNHL